MRFLCEQCKAKYQISDEKVAGKTVRMKCRKCGHMIEVRSEVTESSVANSVPGAAVQAGASAGGGGGVPRPAALKPAPPRSKLATNLTSSPAAKPSLAPGALAGAFNRTVEGAPASSMRPSSADDSAALDVLSTSTAPWYVAINGVPVGPVRLSELRRKAASGLVNESSLVWQDGNEEWRPVKTFPELATLVREAAASGRPSLISSPPFAPNGERVSALPPSPAAPPLGQRANAPRAPAAPRAPTAPGARSNVVPIGGR
ncbi:MAG: GYF domain-containing protein, partial [Polyangiaceae bacterium]